MSSTARTLKCPSCNYKHHLSTKLYGDHSVQLNIAREIFGVTAECPVCLDACSGFMALPCGHILCKDDYQRMGGIMPTPSDPNRYKIVCEVDLRRSDATITRPPLTLTFRDPTTVARSSVPARSATHTHPAPVSTVNTNSTSVSNTTTVVEHSSTSSNVVNGWAAFDAAMRRMEETFSRAPFVSAESSGASNRQVFVFGQGNGASVAASHRSDASTNAPSSILAAAGLTGATTAQLVSGGQGNGDSVAVSHRSAASTNARSSVLTAAELLGAIHPQPFVLGDANGAGAPFPPMPTFPALPWYEIARPQLPTQNSSTLQPRVSGAGVAAPLSIATGGGLSGSAAVQNSSPSLRVAYSGNAASASVAVPQVASRRVTRQSASSATVPPSDSVAPRRSTRVKRPAPV